jgi:hypothetical protein
MKARPAHSSQHVVHVTSFPSGKWTWTLEKHWDSATIDAFLAISQNWFWQLAQAAPYMRGAADSAASRRFSWALRENQPKKGEQAATGGDWLWAQAQSYFGHFVRFRLLVGRFENPQTLLPEECDDWVCALITGLFLTSQCDFVNVIIVDPVLERRLAKIFPEAHKLSVFPTGCEFLIGAFEVPSSRIEVNEYCLTRASWVALEKSQSYQQQHRYLRSRFEMARDLDRRHHQPGAPKRLSFWQRLLGRGRA